jgi:glutaredoxin 2
VPVYRPRDAEHTVLHQVVARHLEAFLRTVAEAGDSTGLPQFVEREFREFLTCGVVGPAPPASGVGAT